MVTNKKVLGKAMSLPAGIGLGTAVSLLISLAGCAVLALLLQNETIRMEALGYGAMVVLLVSAFLGALLSAGVVKRRRLLVCLIQAGLYFGSLLLINGLAFGGAVTGVWVTALLILGGAASAALLGMPGGGKKMGIRKNGVLVKLYKKPIVGK